MSVLPIIWIASPARRRCPLSPFLIGIIVDDMRIAPWQAEALRAVAPGREFVIYSCTNTRSGPRSWKHMFYYLLNLWAIRNRFTIRRPIPSDLPVRRKHSFRAEHDGVWQRLPPEVLQLIAEDHLALILKFGMGLLRVPPSSELPIPILSYHHGDPREFRGRPAGFYELLQGRDLIGQVVQRLSNELDAGSVLAFGETKAHKHSYRATLIEAYSHSPLLLPQAIDNALTGRTFTFPKGRNYRLPSNGTVARFASRSLWHLGARLLYGAFVEKRWQVAEVTAASTEPVEAVRSFAPLRDWAVVKRPTGYRFIADPFYHPRADGVLVEAMRKSTGDGEILHISANRSRLLLSCGKHLSYPSVFSIGDRHFLLPEMSTWSPPKLFRLNDDKAEDAGELDLPGRARLIDPTLFEHDDTIFLFASRESEAPGVLRLWVSNSLSETFTEHPCSPIRVSPAGSRMGGSIIRIGKRLYRVGQDFGQHYGDGVILFEIRNLSRKVYQETECARLRFADVKGPHTLNFRNGRVLFDFYEDAVTPLAGLRRLKAWIRSHSNG